MMRTRGCADGNEAEREKEIFDKVVYVALGMNKMR